MVYLPLIASVVVLLGTLVAVCSALLLGSSTYPGTYTDSPIPCLRSMMVYEEYTGNRMQ